MSPVRSNENIRYELDERCPPAVAIGVGVQGILADVTRSGSWSQSRLGLGLRKWRCCGITPRFITSTALISPASPAADSRCPILVFA